MKVLQTSALPLGYVAIIWSGKGDSNSRPSPWQGDALPLSYSRMFILRTKKYGRSGRIRTCDPLVPSQVLYQAEPRPDLYYCSRELIISEHVKYVNTFLHFKIYGKFYLKIQ